MAGMSGHAASNEVKMVLFGTTGTGRSATVQSILRGADSGVVSGGGWNPVTNQLQMEKTDFGGYKISVLDTPGIHGDKSLDPLTATKKTIDEASSMRYFPDGVDVVVLVFSYNKRFSSDEVETVQILKTLLPKDWLKSHGIILFTGGDNCLRDYRDDLDFSFPKWCRNQRGPMGDLMKECNYRCVLFDNRPDNNKRHESQLQELIKCVITVRGNNHGERLSLLKHSESILGTLMLYVKFSGQIPIRKRVVFYFGVAVLTFFVYHTFGERVVEWLSTTTD